ncbi:MAG: PAS domain-containing protein, partial [Promethearchaeota archaeon]
MHTTKPKKVEGEIFDEKQFMGIALDAQRDTFFVFDPSTGKALRWNKSFREITGYSNEEIANLKAPESYYSISDLEKARRATSMIDNEGTALLEMDLITKTGKIIPFEYIGTRISDEDGNLKYIVSIGRDITERKKRAQELKESEEKYRLFVQNFQGIAYQSNFLNFQPNFFLGTVEEITGYTSKDLMNGNPSWDKLIHPEDLPRFIQKGKELPSSINQTTDIEYRIFTKNGEVRWVKDVVQIVYDDTNKLVVQGVVYDITEKKLANHRLIESEEKFRTITEQSLMGICIVQDNKIQDINEAYA